MTECYVTSFSPEGYREYGKEFLEGWIKHAPDTAKLLVYYEKEKPPIKDYRILYRDLTKDVELTNFLALAARKEADIDRTNYRFQAGKFAHKVFALTKMVHVPQCDWLIWIDADVEIFGPLMDFATKKADPVLHENLAIYLGRTSWDHSECGYVAYNMGHPRSREFLAAFRQLYVSGTIFTLDQWHDSFIFDRVREAYEVENCQFLNLAKGNAEKFMHPWPETILGQFSKHNKGPQAKFAKANGLDKQVARPAVMGDPIRDLMKGCRNRYEQIIRVIAQIKPKTIVEFGTWNGDRALQMAKYALQYSEKVHYIGFDLFEEATSTTDSTELNVKQHVSQEEVRQKLFDYRKEHPNFTFALYKGNTREFTKDLLKDVEIDFAFIDGGHSIETIQNDYDIVKHAKVILFDDFYIEGTDIEKFGCNKVVDLIPHVVLPIFDRFDNGLVVAQAVTGFEIDAEADVPIVHQNLDIKTRNAVEDEEIQGNIRYSDRFTKQGKEALVRKLIGEIAKIEGIVPVAVLPAACHEINDTVIIVGGSESWESYLPQIKERSQHHRVFATKSSHDKLIAHGIVPFGCFLLDPRDHVEAAIQNLHPKVTYFAASMCHPTTWDRLIAAKVPVVRYHAGVHAGEEKVIAELGGGSLVFGGTTSGMRGMNALYMMGIRNFDLYGFDSSYSVKPIKAHGRSEKPVMKVNVNGKEFISDPELIAQSKDIEAFIKMMPDATVNINGDGMLAWAVECVKKADPHARNKVIPALAPYQNALTLNDDIQESYWIDNAIQALKLRREKIIDLKAQLPTFEAFRNA